MTKSVILMVLVSIMVIESSLSFNAFAICKTCGAQEDWSASANNFLEGKPINDTPSSLSNPQRNRLMNSDFNSSLLKENTVNPANSPNNLAATSTLNISLKDINAMPNPANSGSPVMITTSFGNNSSNSQTIPETNMTAYAIIKNSAGVEVGRVNLERTSGEEYAGIWNANQTEGAYKATIVASAPGVSKTFNDALQIDVSKAA
ncbi:Uncharacterised protein [uncultured archaeon]|nr:Uncharacterised protein [uncultured archaeon]